MRCRRRPTRLLPDFRVRYSCSIDGADQFVNFIHVGVKLKSQSGPVEILQGRGTLRQKGEAGFVHQAHLTLLYVSVIQSVHAAEQIRELNKSHQSPVIGGFFRVVVVAYHLNQFGRKLPALGQQPPALGVRETQNTQFCFMQRDSFRFSHLPGGSKFLGQHPEVHNNSQIVQQTRQVSLPWIGKINLSRQMTANQRASQRMLPKNYRIQTCPFARQHVEHATGHGDVADMMKPEADNGSTQRLRSLGPPKDIHVHNISGRVEGQVPDVFYDHGARDLAAGVAHQVFEQGKFLGGEIDAAAGAFGAVLHAVEFEIVDFENRFRGQMAAAQQGANSGGEFAEGKWFGEIIVGAGIEALHTVFDFAAQSQHQHRQAGTLKAQMAEHIYAIHAGEIEIEYDQVVLILGAHGARLFAIGGNIGGVVFGFEPLANEVRQGGVVFGYQNSHKWALITERF